METREALVYRLTMEAPRRRAFPWRGRAAACQWYDRELSPARTDEVILRMRCALGLLVGMLACSPDRPSGAYEPVERPTDMVPFDQEPDGGGRDDDGGLVTVDPFGDAGGQVDPTNPLSVLTGRYLMRVDAYSTASATRDLNTLTLDNRVSNLLLAQVELKSDGTLRSREQLCTQSYENKCVKSCTNWRTNLDRDTPLFCQRQVPVIERDWQVDAAGNLVTASSQIAIGFDEDPAIAALPVDETDPRVWKLGTERYGINTQLLASVGPLALPLDCKVASAQRFATAFAGKLDLARFGAQALVQKPMRVESSSSTAATIFVKGTPDTICNKSSLAATSAQPDQIVVVRFQRYESSDGCPGNFETLFKPLPGRPTAGELM